MNKELFISYHASILRFFFNHIIKPKKRKKKGGASPALRSLRLPQHILYKNRIPLCAVLDKHVGHRPDQFPILDNGAAAHECVNIGPTSFSSNFIRFYRKTRLNKPFLSHMNLF